MDHTTDLAATESELRAIAEEIGLPVLFAVYGGPQVLVSADTPLHDLLAIAKASGAPFVTLDAEPFDMEDFTEGVRRELARNDLALSDRALALIEREDHSDEIERVSLDWAANGFHYSVLFVADWSGALADRVTELADEGEEPLYVKAFARINDLAAELEALPEFRSTQPSRRRAAGTLLIEGLATDEDDPEMRRRAVDAAYSIASKRAAEAYYAMEARKADLSRALAASETWDHVFSRPARIAAATRYLTEEIGYAPTKTDAEAFARLTAEMKRR